MRRHSDRLQDILAAISKIEEAYARGKSAFDTDELLQVWMVHHLMIIGEAVRSIDPALKLKHPEVQWRDIGAMRNIIVHDYFRINKQIVWDTVEKDIPALKSKIIDILKSV